MAYTDKFGTFFGRLNDDGNVVVLHESGEVATRLDQSLYPEDGDGSKGVRYEHPEGIVLSHAAAVAIGLEIE